MVNTYRTGGTCCPKSKSSVKSTVIPSVLLWKTSQICSVCWHPGEIWTLMKATLRCGTLNIKFWMTLRENWRFSVTATDRSVTSYALTHKHTDHSQLTHWGQGSEVTGVRFHGASVEDSDPSPTPSASVINPENTHKGLNICTWKDLHWVLLCTCSGYKNKKNNISLENLFFCLAWMIETTDLLSTQFNRSGFREQFVMCVLPAVAGPGLWGSPAVGVCACYGAAPGGGGDLDVRDQEEQLTRGKSSLLTVYRARATNDWQVLDWFFYTVILD